MAHDQSGPHRLQKTAYFDEQRQAWRGEYTARQSRLHPLRPAKSLAYEEVVRLREAIRNVLQQALMFGGSTLRDYRDGDGRPGRNQDHVVVYRRHGTPCPACGTVIERIVVAQRGTHICPTCQPSP